MSVESPTWMQEMLSPPRFARYLGEAGGDRAAALRLYCWNVEVSLERRSISCLLRLAALS